MRHYASTGRRLMWTGLVLLIGAGAAACGAGPADGTAGAGLRVAMDTVAGVVHVRNEGAPPRWSLEEVVTLGTPAGAEAGPQEFGRIRGVAADEDGRVYVADGMATEIRVFGETGRFVRRIGRKGGGPGEFEVVQSIGWLGDRLAVLDPGNGRIGLLSPEGEWLGQRRYLALTGNLSIHQTTPTEIYTPAYRVRNGRGEMVFVRQTLEGPADTLPNPSAESSQALRVMCTHDAGQGISTYRATFAPRLLRVPAPGGVRAEVWTADYRIAFTTAAGDTVRVVERDLPRLEVADEVWQEEVAAFQAFRERFTDERCEPSRLPRPEAMERIRTIVFDDRGRMWVERRMGEGFALDAFDVDGRLLGTVPIPDRLERVRPYIRGNRLVLVETDELDIEYVTVFEIEGVAASD